MAEYNLIGITRTLRRNSRYVIGVTVAAMAIGAIGSLVRKKQYKAAAGFFISSPYYNDRSSVFHSSDHGGAMGYFAADEDIDKVIGLARTEDVKKEIALKANLQEYYKLDTTRPREEVTERLVNAFESHFKLERSEYGIMEASYTAPDAKKAAEVANIAVSVISERFSGFFQGMRSNVVSSLTDKIHMADSAIKVQTDTLAALRDRYGLYDIISPARQGIINGSIQNKGAGMGYAVEQIQNVEANKDQLVTDRTRYMSLINEYSAGDNMLLIRAVSPAIPSNQPAGLGLVFTVIACAIAGFILSALWVLFVAFLRSTKE